MTGIMILLTLTALAISSGNHSDHRKMSSKTTTDSQTKQDSSSGYALVNGLKMYYEIHGTGMPLVRAHWKGLPASSWFKQ